MAAKATPAKLRDGSWGARTAERVIVGQTIEVTSKAGKRWLSSVKEVVWTDGSVCIVRTGDAAPKRKTSRQRPGFYGGRGYRIDGTGDEFEQ